MSCDSSTFSGESVECQWSKLMWKPSRCFGRVAAIARDERLRRDAFGFRLQHDRRAVRVVGADEMHLVALHPLEAHPDVGLDVLHDVADVERAVRVRQRRRDEQPAAAGGAAGSRTSGKTLRLAGETSILAKARDAEYRTRPIFG